MNKSLQNNTFYRKYFVIHNKWGIMLIASILALSYPAIPQQVPSIEDVGVKIASNNKTLKTIFSELEELTAFNITYDKATIGKRLNDKIVIQPSHNMKVSDVLMEISKQTNIKFRQVNKNISATPPVSNKAVSVKITDVEVSGTITDENGEPLPGASVVIKGTFKGTITDMDGKYTLVVPDDAVLVVSFLGYADQEVMVSGRSIVDVQMVMDVQSLDEVVVVGYGTTTKRDLTGSVSSVDAEVLTRTQNQSIDQKLSGLMAGVQVTSSGGRPGSGAEVHIRGLSTIRGSNQPLYVIDGTPIVVAPNFGDNPNTIGGKEGSRENPLLGINPDDIERIDVLKDASSAAIYGSRAANGVVLITTKHGRKNTKPQANFSVTTAIQNPLNTYQPLNAQQFKTYLKRLDPLIEDTYFSDGNTNWQDEIINKNALMTRYSASVSGGNDSQRYYLSGSATNHQGVLKDNRVKRYNLSAKIDSKIARKLNVGASINYNYSINKSSTITSLLDGLSFRPDKPIFDKNGNYTTQEFKKIDQNRVLKIVSIERNPIGNAVNAPNTTKLHNFIGNVFGEYEITDHLKVKSQVNVGVYNSLASAYHPIHTTKAQQGRYGSIKKPLSNLVVNDSRSYNTTWSNTLSYSNVFADVHTINAVVGISWDYYRMDLTKDVYYGFPDDNILVNPASSQKSENVSDLTIVNALNSMFGRINYTYKGKYLLTFTARRDGSTKFGPNNRYGFFPSGAIAWNMDKEEFMSGVRQISYLKLRMSAGITGSNNLPSFTYLNYSSTLSGDKSSRYNGVNGVVPLGKPNPDIRWEETKQVDAGVEFGLFEDRLNAQVVYFVKNTSGIIMETSIANQHGFRNFNANLADVSNKGWEIKLGGDIIKNKNFRWNSSLNISFIRNKVESFNGGRLTGLAGSGITEGMPMGFIRGLEVVKIAQTQKEIDDLNDKARQKHGPNARYQSSLQKPGDYIFKDNDGDGKIDQLKDAVGLGDINPNYFGGWANSLHYKNFDFSFQFQFVQGVKKHWSRLSNFLDGTQAVRRVEKFPGFPERVVIERIEKNTTTIVHNAWSPNNRGAFYARPGSSTHNLLFPHSRSVFDASFIRLRSVTLGYTLPSKWLNKTLFSSVRLAISANNLLTFTKYPGLDPEASDKGTDRQGTAADLSQDNGENYPTVRSFAASINVTF